MRKCACGSGLEPFLEVDGYGIPLCWLCDRCRSEQLAKFRPDIFERYDCDEPVEEE
jgi:hypothetical protein